MCKESQHNAEDFFPPRMEVTVKYQGNKKLYRWELEIDGTLISKTLKHHIHYYILSFYKIGHQFVDDMDYQIVVW